MESSRQDLSIDVIVDRISIFENTVKSRLYVQVGTQKYGRRTERDVQVKIIFHITPCEVFWMRLYQLDVQTSGTYK